MKVLMFGWELPPFNSGGLGVACFELAKSLIEKDVQLTFVLPRRVDLPNNHFRILFANVQNLEIIAINSLLMPYVTSTVYDRQHILSETSIYAKDLFSEVKRYAVEARRIAESEEFEIIHAHDWLSFPAGIEAKRVSGKPLIVHVHATEYDRTGGRGYNEQVYEIEKYGMEVADAVVAVSNYTKSVLVDHYGITPDKIQVIHNGIDAEKYVLPPEDDSTLKQFRDAGCKVVLFAGRITMQKGPDYFLKAAKKVLEYNPHVVFVFAGSGDMENQMIREAAELGISDKVIFAGFLRDGELNKIYKSADLFVMPSISEPFGIAPLEAAASGTPVLISKQSGVSEVFSHVLKTDFWDVDDMTDKILSVVNHDSLKTTLSENGNTQVKGISWGKAAQLCLDLYAKFLGRRNHS